MIEELWETIPGYPNYSVSNLGEIVNNTTHKVLKPFGGGYKRLDQVSLSLKNKKKYFYVHRLVAAAFLAEYHPDFDVLHKSTDIHDNSVGNLERGAWSKGVPAKRERVYQ